MSLSQNILDNLEGFSLAKYSTWFFYRPDRLLLDCGEGVSTTLGNRIYAVERILLSHGHGDHVAGIPGFLYSRASSMGDTSKPLDIYYPAGDASIEKLRRYVTAILPRPPYPLEWHAIEAGARLELGGPDRSIEAFATRHLHRGLSLGYRIVEVRDRLKPEFSALSQPEIVQIVRDKGRAHLTENYSKNLLVYSGDSMPLPADEARDAELLIHEATFLDDGEREHDIHATVGEALRTATDAGAHRLLLFHLSTRYTRKAVREAIRKSVVEMGIEIPVHYTFPRGLPTNFVTVADEAIPSATKRK